MGILNRIAWSTWVLLDDTDIGLRNKVGFLYPVS